MNWYDDTTRKSFIATYKQEKVMRAEIEAAAQRGFVAQGVARKGNEWTVTFSRDDRALMRVQLEQVVSLVHQERAKLHAMVDKVSDSRRDVLTHFQAARTAIGKPTSLEQGLLKSITALASNSNVVNRQRQSLLATYTNLARMRDQAAKSQVDLPSASGIDIPSEVSSIQADIDAETPTAQHAQSLLSAQRGVVASVQVWQKTVGDHWRTRARVAQLDVKAEAGSTEMQANESIFMKLVNAVDGDLSKHRTKLESTEHALHEQEAALLRDLEARDMAIAQLFPAS